MSKEDAKYWKEAYEVACKSEESAVDFMEGELEQWKARWHAIRERYLSLRMVCAELRDEMKHYGQAPYKVWTKFFNEVEKSPHDE